MNPPIPVEVRENARHHPVSFKLKGRWLSVVSIDDVCSLDEEWWRDQPIIRMYYQVTMEDDQRVTIFRDMVDGMWYRQYA